MKTPSPSYKEIWKELPDDHDYPAAQDYLELIFTPEIAAKYVEKLKKAPVIIKKSKDLLRASRLSLLPETNIHVKEDLKRFKKKEKLSPVLLVRTDHDLIIADGYHRICSSYYLTEDLDVPCKLV